MTDISAVLALADPDGWWGWKLLGRFHPAAVHFPIALIMIAAVVDAVQVLRRRRVPETPVIVCLAWGAATAVLAAGLGLASGAFEKPDAEMDRVLSLHRILGLAVAVAAPVTAFLAVRARRRGTGLVLYRAGLWGAAVLVGWAGHLGGVLVFGEGYYSSALPGAAPPPLPPAAAAADVDFARDIQPILQAHCIKCHGPEKQKGKLRLDSQDFAMKGGDAGKAIVPGRAEESPLYLLLLKEDGEDRMPPKAKPLSADKIALIRAWIEQGARWAALRPAEGRSP